jgi:hypothetical protein
VNSGKAMVVCSPVKAAADRHGPLPFGSKEKEATGTGPFSRAARSACGMEMLIWRWEQEGKAGAHRCRNDLSR